MHRSLSGCVTLLSFVTDDEAFDAFDVRRLW
jgi:hypothetical protein